MTRLSGLEQKQAPWHLRWFYGVMRKMFGKELTPSKDTDATSWAGLGQHWHGSRPGPQAARLAALHQLAKVRTASGSAVRFEWTSILPWAERPV